MSVITLKKFILDHQFYHKWAVLTDPDDTTGGPKGIISILIKDSVYCYYPY